MSLAMTRAEREAFLAQTYIAVISVVAAGRAPLILPVWYSYEPGGVVRFATAATSKKTELIREAGRLSLCVQNDSWPYRYISVEGPAVISEPDFERDIRQVALRYLGKERGERYLANTTEERERAGEVLITLTPERWLSEDYTKMRD